MITTPTTDTRLDCHTVTTHQILHLTTNFFYNPSTLMTNNHWFFNNKICTSQCLKIKNNKKQIKIETLYNREQPLQSKLKLFMIYHKSDRKFIRFCSKSVAEIDNQTHPIKGYNFYFRYLIINTEIKCNSITINSIYLEVMNITPTDTNSFHSNSNIMGSFKNTEYETYQ